MAKMFDQNEYVCRLFLPKGYDGAWLLIDGRDVEPLIECDDDRKYAVEYEAPDTWLSWDTEREEDEEYDAISGFDPNTEYVIYGPLLCKVVAEFGYEDKFDDEDLNKSRKWAESPVETTKATVVVLVRDGVVEDVKLPPHIRVIVRTYDLNMAPEDYGPSEERFPFVDYIYE